MIQSNLRHDLNGDRPRQPVEKEDAKKKWRWRRREREREREGSFFLSSINYLSRY